MDPSDAAMILGLVWNVSDRWNASVLVVESWSSWYSHWSRFWRYVSNVVGGGTTRVGRVSMVMDRVIWLPERLRSTGTEWEGGEETVIRVYS